MKNKTLHQAFPIVAAAIGNRFGIKVSVGGDQAYTNGKTIQLPAYEGNDPDYQDYAWGLLAHEAAHIRYSDFSIEFGASVLRRRLSGAIEDVRIEYELAKQFPGTRLTLRTVIEKMIANGGFIASTEDDHPANVLYGYVLKSLRARVLEQVALKPLVDQTEAVLKTTFPNGVVVKLKALLSEVPDELSSEHDCLHLADRILAMIEQEVEQQQQKQNNQSSPSAAEENKLDTAADDQADSESSEQADGADETLDSKEDTDTTGQDKEDEENSLPSSMSDSEIDSGSDNESGSGLADEQDDVEPLAEEANANPVNSGGNSGGYETETEISNHSQILDSLLTAGDGDIDPDVFDTIKSTLALNQGSVAESMLPIGNEPPLDELAGLTLFSKVQSESVKIRAALQGLVQSQRLNRTKHSNRGRRIDGTRLHHLALGDSKVFLRSSVQAAPNTAIHLLVDKSESMGYQVLDRQTNQLITRMPIALEASLALALALEGLPGVNPGVTAFPGGYDDAVYRLLAHGQRLRSRASAFSLSPSGSTPMTEAIWFGAAALLRCQEPRKILMVMTDGQPNDTLSTLAILQSCRDSGIETVGIGLGIEVSHLFPVAIVINDLQELRTRLFELSKSLLLSV